MKLMFDRFQLTSALRLNLSDPNPKTEVFHLRVKLIPKSD